MENNNREIRKAVTPYRVIMPCGQCSGEMKAGPNARQYKRERQWYIVHECTDCHRREALDKEYPFIEYVDAAASETVRYHIDGIRCPEGSQAAEIFKRFVDEVRRAALSGVPSPYKA